MFELSPPAAITAARLRMFAPRCDYLALAPKLDQAAAENEINTPRRVRHWLAQLHHESMGFTRLEEDLDYTAARLNAVFPKYFPTVEAAAPFAHNPRALANKVYGGRMGNVGPMDGWLYRGRSPIGLTGLAGYREAGPWVGVDLVKNPDLAARPEIGARIAAAWWRSKGLNQIVDPDANERPMADVAAALNANEMDDVRQARQRINGGVNGLDDAEALLRLAGTIWRG